VRQRNTPNPAARKRRGELGLCLTQGKKGKHREERQGICELGNGRISINIVGGEIGGEHSRNNGLINLCHARREGGQTV